LRPPMSLKDAEAWLAERRTQRDEVLQIAETGGVLWHDADRQAFATIQRGRHSETWNVRSRDYKLYLVAEYRRQHGRVPGDQASHEALDAIEAAALDGAEHEAFVRVAGDDPKSPEKIYLDLVDESWRVVEIDARGWQIISNPPVHFFPPKGLRGLPPPKRINIGTGIRKLQALVNVTGDAFIMHVSWMFACLWPSGPYTILVLTGEHGTAKTTAAEVARESRS
jgi:putative DNA primase/helicase